jgi:hypothetical protein
MIKAMTKFFFIFLVSTMMVSCNQIIEFEGQATVEEAPPEVILDEDLAFETLNNYYTHLLNKRYAMALFHVDSSENPSDTVIGLEALDFFEQTLDYSMTEFEVDKEKTIVKDGEVIFFVDVSISYHKQENLHVAERVYVTETEGVYKIVNIQSSDMFLPYRSFRYELEPPRNVSNE